METSNTMLQLIYYDLTFTSEFQKYIRDNHFDEFKNSYNSVAIIGCQSSGKSTLLNKLFNTKFEVLNTEERVGQTTKGIWTAFNPQYKICILDCEGTDSKERGEDRGKFEHCSSLFALSLSDVLIINMWSTDVGRYTASNYGVLKIVFEMNLKLFQQHCEKKLVIILRDFNSKTHNLESIKKIIKTDITNIWNEIKKPEKYENSTPDKFFLIEFVTLSHKIFFEEQFDEDCKQFASRFLPSHENYIFDHSESSKNVPLDGFHKYCIDIWDTIINEKDLNLPTQKEMLAIYRCNEIKDESIAKFDKQITQLQKDSTTGLVQNFKNVCEEIQEGVLNNYDETANLYYEKIYRDVRNQLHDHLLNIFYVAFTNQGRIIVPQIQKNLKKEIDLELKKDDNFKKISENVKSKILDDYLNKMSDIRLSDDWDCNITSVKEIIEDIIQSAKATIIEQKKSENIKKLKHQIDDCLSQRIDSINVDFWTNFNKDYLEYIYMGFTALKNCLTDYYEIGTTEFVEFSNDIETEIYKLTKLQLEKKLKEISKFMVEIFKKEFWNDDQGIPIKWASIQENEIEKRYKKTRERCFEVIEIFKNFKLIQSPIKVFNYEANEDHYNKIMNNITDLINLESSVGSLFKGEELLSIKKQFQDGIENILEDAKRRHAGSFNAKLPLWTWILLVYLGYDDVLRMLSSYWIIPVIILLAVYGALFAVGLGGVFTQSLIMIKNLIVGKINGAFSG